MVFLLRLNQICSETVSAISGLQHLLAPACLHHSRTLQKWIQSNSETDATVSLCMIVLHSWSLWLQSWDVALAFLLPEQLHISAGHRSLSYSNICLCLDSLQALSHVSAETECQGNVKHLNVHAAS